MAATVFRRSHYQTTVEILDLRHFASPDLRPLLDEEVSAWGSLLCWDYRSSADMILRYVDAKILPGYAAVERGNIVGYSFFVYEGSKGVVGDLFVSPRRPDGRLIEAQIALHVIETLQQSPGIHRVEAQLLTHLAGGLSAVFSAAGFQRYRRLFLALELQHHDPNQLPPISLPPDIQIRPWLEQDYQPAASIITASYRAHIDSEINDQYRTHAGSIRFLNNIVRFPGCGVFDAESSFSAIHRPSNTLIGLILCSRVRQDVGHVTQVCLLPDYRGHSIGENLIVCTSNALRHKHCSLLTLTVTEANRRAVDLYRRLGFTENSVFDAFVREG